MRDRSHEFLTLARLRWLAIVAPLGFMAVVWELLHRVLTGLHHFPGILVLVAWAVLGTALFSVSVFRVIARLEQRVLEQNRELEQTNRELAALLAVGRAGSSSLDLAEVVDKALEATLEVTPAEAAEVWVRGEGNELRLVAHRGLASEAFTERRSLAFGEGLPGCAAESGEVIAVHDLPADGRFARAGVVEAGFDSYCAVPLTHGGETVGVLGVASRERRICGQSELRLLEGVGERLAAAIENARLHRRVLDGAVVDERVRIARELHDGLAQVLGYINAQTLAIKKLVARGQVSEAQRQLDAMEDAARNVYSDVREAIVGLRTSRNREEGVVQALRKYAEEYRTIAGFEIRVEADERAAALRIEPSTEIQLVRIAQEALANVRKHARATETIVRVHADDDALEIEIADDGGGFDPDAPVPIGWPRFGLQTMRERASAVGGTLEVASKRGAGTTVRVTVPTRQDALYASAAR